MQAVAVGWLIYDLTGSALALGLIGLVQFIPPLALSLIAGQIVDRYSRKFILIYCYIVEFTVSAGIAGAGRVCRSSGRLIFGLLLVNAVARTFEAPALQSLVPSTVPREILDARGFGARIRRKDVATDRPGAGRTAVCFRRRASTSDSAPR